MVKRKPGPEPGGPFRPKGVYRRRAPELAPERPAPAAPAPAPAPPGPAAISRGGPVNAPRFTPVLVLDPLVNRAIPRARGTRVEDARTRMESWARRTVPVEMGHPK